MLDSKTSVVTSSISVAFVAMPSIDPVGMRHAYVSRYAGVRWNKAVPDGRQPVAVSSLRCPAQPTAARERHAAVAREPIASAQCMVALRTTRSSVEVEASHKGTCQCVRTDVMHTMSVQCTRGVVPVRCRARGLQWHH
jgi:hypothetical protein